MHDTASWLAGLGLDRYIEVFAADEIDFDVLRQLTDDDLRELGLPIGPRRKILAAIATLNNAKSPTGAGFGLKSARPRRDAERRQMTVVFIDLVGSTELSQRLDPEDMREVLSVYQNSVFTEVGRYQGHVAKLMGDGVLVYFGWPSAHEDDAERAVRASLATVEAIARLTTPAGEPLKARIGIATGLVVVGDLIGHGPAQEESVVGEAPNLAARLQSLAEPDTVVIGNSTHRLVAGLFDVTDLGFHQLKGFAKPIPAWRITGEADVEDRFAARHGVITPMVGRSDELELLLHRWQMAREGTGQAVLLSGEAGIGKSRLVAALEEQLSAEPHARLHYFCSPHHANSALYPVIKQLERAVRLGPGDSSNAKLDQLEGLLRQSGSDSADAAPLLAELLSIDTTGRYAPHGLSPQARKSHTLRTLVQLLAGLAARRPVLMIFEDVHWADPMTREWLDMLIDSLRNLPLLLIVIFRPEFRPPWSLSSFVTLLQLTRLDREYGSAIVNRVAGEKALPPELRDQILARTDGVPLFVEELTKAVLESGLLTVKGDRLLLSSLQQAVPSTLQDSLMARLDRLGWIKGVAQAGACIGRVFHHRLLAKVIDLDEAQLAEALERLADAELLFRNGIAPETSYTFKHALVQDAAYQSLLKDRRQKLHSAIAATLEAEFPEVASSEPEALAHHYGAAGMAELAIPYWLEAGQGALKRSANVEAIAHLTKGIDALATLPTSENHQRQELQCQSALALALQLAEGFGTRDVLKAHTRVRILSEILGDKDQLFVALCGEATYYTFAGNVLAADERGLQCLEVACSDGDEHMLMEAHHRLWPTKFHLGRYDEAERHLDHGLMFYDPVRHCLPSRKYSGHDPGVCCRNHSARLLWHRGFPDQALRRVQEAVALAEQISHPFSMILAHYSLSELRLMRREPDEARSEIAKWGERAKELATSMAADAKFQTGWALAEDERWEESIPLMRDGIAESRAAGNADTHFHLCMLAQSCGGCGRISEGLSLLEEALAIVAATGAGHQVPEVLRVKGDLLARLGSPETEDCLTEALTLAREQGVRMLELRAATSLARLYRSEGRGSRARDVLSPVYDWFVEGFDTRDLIDAGMLLNTLR